MTLTIQLSPEAESRLQRDAAREGLEPDDYARRLIERELHEPAAPEAPAFDWHTSTIEERLRAFDEMIERLREFNLPSIPMEALRRENMYEDRGL